MPEKVTSKGLKVISEYCNYNQSTHNVYYVKFSLFHLFFSNLQQTGLGGKKIYYINITWQCKKKLE
ncbi:hypothetical protein AII34_21130 [Salmonella enterica]|nr:hypothetical protein [Salmonella enterica]EBN2521042.1 hypothetical protein [Salmonella enterica]